MSSSDLSSLSSPPSSDEEPPPKLLKLKQLPLSFKPTSASSSPSPEPPERELSPAHEYVLADNDDIAVIVMFRSRFTEAFPKNVPNFGPQDIERGVIDPIPSIHIENLLCALLALVLNRKKHVERQHYGRALEEAIQTHRTQWPLVWEHMSPLSGGQTFAALNPTQRLHLLRILTWWSLSSSEVITRIIKDSYKQQRQENDLNQPLSVQSWGSDARKRRYWLIEGQHDTPFRLYRESNPKLVHNTWWTVAGTIDEIKNIADELILEKSQAGKRLSACIISAIPRLEETEEKRKRKEYRQNRKAQFERPHPGFSLYEGRTRGKRARYTFSDEEDDFYDDSASDAPSLRRSSRNDGRSQPSTSSGVRHVRSRFGRPYTDPHLTSTLEGSSRYSTDGGDSSDVLDPIQSKDGSQRSPKARTAGSGGLYGRSGHDSHQDFLDSGGWTDDIGSEDNLDEEEYRDEANEDDDKSVTDEDGDVSPPPNKTLIVRLPYRKPYAQHILPKLDPDNRDKEHSKSGIQAMLNQSASMPSSGSMQDVFLQDGFSKPVDQLAFPTVEATDPRRQDGVIANDVLAQLTKEQAVIEVQEVPKSLSDVSANGAEEQTTPFQASFENVKL